MRAFYNCISFILIVVFFTRCANVVPPTGGPKDITPPKLLSVKPGDSLLNTKVTRLDLRFDEFINLNSPNTEVQFSPLLPVPPTFVGNGRTVTMKVPDTALLENTTYRINFGNAIQDLHEGNTFTGYNYIFSTGNYFDSLKISGIVYNASTGLPDSSAQVILYPGNKDDSAVVKEKPQYVTKVEAGGRFNFTGLPARSFRIYALRDANANLVFDGVEEGVAFISHTVMPVDSVDSLIELNLFVEKVSDTAAVDTASSSRSSSKWGSVAKKNDEDKTIFGYTVGVDTTDVRKRTLDITKPIKLTFNKPVDTFNTERIYLSYDSTEISVSTDFNITRDTSKNVLLLNSNWKQDALYTLRLLKGFVKDTSGAEAMPSRFTFRSKSDDDYAKLAIHIPTKYTGEQYILMVTIDKDTVYNEPIIDSMVRLTRLKPGDYRLQVIVDENLNGEWDTGDLLARKQPELVIPYNSSIQLKAGWDNIVDFEKDEGRKHALPKPLKQRGDKARK
jgi:hypothetical protein